MTRSKEDILYRYWEQYVAENGGFPMEEGGCYSPEQEREMEAILDDYAKSIVCANGSLLSDFDDDEEFYTDDKEFYIPEEYAKEQYSYEKAVAYIIDRHKEDELKEWIICEVFNELWLGFDYSQDYFKEAIKDFVFCDYNDFMDYIMEAENGN